MSLLILLRHGQAAFGADDYDQLSGVGLRQAAATGRYWAERGTRFTRLIVGPRQRHRLTAGSALAPLGLAVAGETESQLDEFAEGKLILDTAHRRLGISSRSTDRLEELRIYGAEVDAWAAGETELPGRPSASVFRAGVAAWLKRATASGPSGQQVLAVTSAGVIAAVLAELLELPDAAIGPLMRVTRNASLSEVLFSGTRRGLLSFNGVGHLPEELITMI